MRVIAAVLVLLALAASARGAQSESDAALVGTWTGKEPGGAEFTLVFTSDGTVTMSKGETEKHAAHYTTADGKMTLTAKDDDHSESGGYSLSGDELRLKMDDDAKHDLVLKRAAAAKDGQATDKKVEGDKPEGAKPEQPAPAK